jgi:phosphatidylglycerol---prolipoprotein diacylglyceryl transferase
MTVFGWTVALVLLEIRYPWIDPVALPLPGPIDVRWYGLGYLVGFAFTYFILRRLSRDGFLKLDEDAIGDLITYLVLGVILGARIGYILFYDFTSFAQNPTRILRIWEGGLSFHGGLAGVSLVAIWFVRKHGITWRNLMDSLSLCIPFGIVFVRTANFINGELYGRVTGEHVRWAMRFPTDPVALRLIGAENLPMRERELAIGQAYRSGLWDSVMHQVPLRHPSQLYEAFLEGVVVGLVLWAIYLWARNRGVRLPQGLIGGLFLIGYAVFRSFVELYRQPDAQFRSPDDPLGTVLGPLTMGQTLSLFLLLGGLYLLYLAWQDYRNPAPETTRRSRRTPRRR